MKRKRGTVYMGAMPLESAKAFQRYRQTYPDKLMVVFGDRDVKMLVKLRDGEYLIGGPGWKATLTVNRHGPIDPYRVKVDTPKPKR